MSNKHYIPESEHNKFIWLKQRKFFWIMHVPHARFSEKLNCSNLLTALFGSDSQDDGVELWLQSCVPAKCGEVGANISPMLNHVF